MATARSAQSHQKRVQEILDDAAKKIADTSPLEEEVVLMVEELPPGDRPKTRSPRSTAEETPSDAMLDMVAQSQRLVAEGIGRWIEMTAAPFDRPAGAMEPFGDVLDPRQLVEESFRLAGELLASQKAFALKVIEAFSPARAV